MTSSLKDKPSSQHKANWRAINSVYKVSTLVYQTVFLNTMLLYTALLPDSKIKGDLQTIFMNSLISKYVTFNHNGLSEFAQDFQ